MPLKIAILEDNADRQQVMRNCLSDRFYMYETHIFDDARAMIGFLEAQLSECVAIALDHDLELKPGTDGRSIDPGTGREVADFLGRNPPVCPVIIHTSNSDAAVGMQLVLKDAGWKTRRVLPFEDTQWIVDDWFPAMRRAIVGPIKKRAAASKL